VVVVGLWNLISLAMIIIGPETRANDLNRIDSREILVGHAPASSLSS
jgi:hypothetical protein